MYYFPRIYHGQAIRCDVFFGSGAFGCCVRQCRYDQYLWDTGAGRRWPGGGADASRGAAARTGSELTSRSRRRAGNRNESKQSPTSTFIIQHCPQRVRINPTPRSENIITTDQYFLSNLILQLIHVPTALIAFKNLEIHISPKRENTLLKHKF